MCAVLVAAACASFFVAFELGEFAMPSQGVPTVHNGTAVEPNTGTSFPVEKTLSRNTKLKLLGVDLYAKRIPIGVVENVYAEAWYVDAAKGRKKLKGLDESSEPAVVERALFPYAFGGNEFVSQQLVMVQQGTPPGNFMRDGWVDDLTHVLKSATMRCDVDRVRAEFKSWFPHSFHKGDVFSFTLLQDKTLTLAFNDEPLRRSENAACLGYAVFSNEIRNRKGMYDLIEHF